MLTPARPRPACTALRAPMSRARRRASRVLTTEEESGVGASWLRSLQQVALAGRAGARSGVCSLRGQRLPSLWCPGLVMPHVDMSKRCW